MNTICGVLNKKQNYENEYLINLLLTNSKKHKDANESFYAEHSIALGTRIMVTTPESQHEKQPIHSKSSLYIVCDARIDNQNELHKKLNFQLQNDAIITDIDYILCSYQKWEEKCLDHLVGNFSFAIWDEEKQYLFCAKSKSSTKPFFYSNNDSFFAFSSEVSSLLKLPNFELKPNIESMRQFYFYNGVIDPDSTMYDEVHSLPHGHYMIVSKKGIKIHRYWQPETIKINKNITQDKAAEKFYELLNDAVRCRLRATSPIGIELSGGLDSSSVACLAAKYNHDHSLFALTMQYGDYLCDESKYSNAVIGKTGLKQLSIRADKIDYKEEYSLDFYYNVCPNWPNYVTFTQSFPLMKKARDEGIRIVLTGQGGDFITQGSLYRFADFFKSFKWIKLAKEINHIKCSCKYKINVIKNYIILPMLSEKQKKIIKKLINREVSIQAEKPAKYRELINEEKCQSYALCEHVKHMIGTPLASWTNNNVYQIMERYNMEFWHPYLDSRLIEFALSLPDEYKTYKDDFKITLKEAMKGILPEIVRKRNDKAEFSEAIRDQIDAIDLEEFWTKKYIVDLGIVSKEEISKAIRAYKESSIDDLRVTGLWRLINLEYWYRYNFLTTVK